MDNLVGSDFLTVQRIYDLKGSTLGRQTNLTEKEIEKSSRLKVLKDKNFIELKEKLQIQHAKKEALLEVIERDSKFLEANHLMDYSLLFIKANRPGEAEFKQD